MKFLFTLGAALLLGVTSALATTPPAAVVTLVRKNCLECHDADTS